MCCVVWSVRVYSSWQVTAKRLVLGAERTAVRMASREVMTAAAAAAAVAAVAKTVVTTPWRFGEKL